jgi:xylan 1,4-beta-xylosidase
VAVLHQISQLAARAGVNFQGAVTWAFEFEEQPAFAGYRELATNGIDKPVLNGFRMLGMLGGERVEVSSSGAIATDEFLRSGVSQQPDINAMATREPRRVAVLIWNYQDRDVPMPAAAVDLVLSGLPPGVSRARLENFRIDETHSNAYTEWKRLGSPEKLTHEQLKGLEAAGQLQSGDAPRQIEIVKGSAAVNLSLPTQSLSLIRVTW